MPAFVNYLIQLAELLDTMGSGIEDILPPATMRAGKEMYFMSSHSDLCYAIVIDVIFDKLTLITKYYN